MSERKEYIARQKQWAKQNRIKSSWVTKNNGYVVGMGRWYGAGLTSEGYYTPLGTIGVATCIALSIRCENGTVLAHLSQPGEIKDVGKLEEWVFERMKEIIPVCVGKFGRVQGIQISANQGYHLNSGGLAVNFYNAVYHNCSRFGAFDEYNSINCDGRARGVVEALEGENEVYIDENGEMKVFDGAKMFGKWGRLDGDEDGECGPDK